MSTVRGLALSATILAVAGCRAGDPVSAPLDLQASFSRVPENEPAVYSPALDRVRQAIRAAGVTHVELALAELRVASHPASWQAATTILANDRSHLFPVLFVEDDPRRGHGAVITYLVDQSEGSALSLLPNQTVVTLANAVTEPVLDVSTRRWTPDTHCQGPAVAKVADSGADPDLADAGLLQDASLLGTTFADITHAGWLPASFFNAIVPGGSQFLLGVTFSFVFVDNNGNPTDVDRNGFPDAAFREIYYNRALPWTTSATNPFSVDIESTAAHEVGHAYGLGHFGKVFLDQKGNIKFAPLALMNAVYAFAFREITGADRSSFCSIWSNSW
jgi:hypothetical protein